MMSLADQAREYAIPELFGGNDQAVYQKLVLDHLIPLVLNAPIDTRLGARVRHLDNGEYKTQMILVSLGVPADTIQAGPANWPIYLSSYAYQLVSALRLEVSRFNQPTFIVINVGDIGSMNPHMRRIWIK